MKPVDNNRFEVYRRQGRSLHLSANARHRILEAVRSCETSKAGASPSEPHRRRKATSPRTHLSSAFALKAACLLIIISVGLNTIFAILPSRNLETPQAIATSPLRPYERIEVHYLDSSIVATSQEALCVVPVTLYVSDLSSSQVTINLQGSNGVYLISSGSLPTETTPHKTTLRVACTILGQIHLQLLCPTSITREQFDEGSRSTNSPNWTSTEPVKLIERLRGSQLTIKEDGGDQATFRIELDDFPTLEAIAAQLRRGNDYIPPYFSLDRKDSL